jgi:hypothetical protein
VLQPRDRETASVSAAYINSTDSGSNRPGVLWLVGASSRIGYCLAGGWLPRAGRWPLDAIPVTHNQHADQYLRVHQGASSRTVIGGEVLAEIAQVEKGINLSKHMILGT